ncbi:MAG: hypothetical protein ACOX9R_16475, partial [Armatimonadota bacterium]
FALESGGWDRLAAAAAGAESEASVRLVRALYEDVGAFDRARALVDGLRERCLGLADDVGAEALGELLRFLTRTVLRERRQSRAPGS